MCDGASWRPVCSPACKNMMTKMSLSAPVDLRVPPRMPVMVGAEQPAPVKPEWPITTISLFADTATPVVTSCPMTHMGGHLERSKRRAASGAHAPAVPNWKKRFVQAYVPAGVRAAIHESMPPEAV
jgi:hypothetical protein